MEQLLTNIQNLDQIIFQAIQSLRTPLLDQAMTALSSIGNHGILWLLILACLGFLGGKAGRRIAVLGFISLLTGWLLGDFVLKPLFERPRPFMELGDIDLLVDPPADFSFPSGHTAVAFATALVVAMKGKNLLLRTGILLLALLVGFSRVYLGVHYPGDVLGGLVLGAFCAGWVVFSYNKICWEGDSLPEQQRFKL